MNIESVKTLFLMYSGEEDVQKYMPVIELAAEECGRMLRPGADSSDPRLDHLCAAMAALRLRVIQSGQDRRQYTYAGKVISPEGSALSHAEDVLRMTLNMCSDLVKASDFVFIGFSGKEDAE